MKYQLFALIIIFWIQKTWSLPSEIAPILTIHGIGSEGDYGIVDALKDYYHTYAQCYQIGDKNPQLFSIIFNIKIQGAILGNKIHNDPYLKDGNFSIMGISQGSVISKYIIEYCPLKYPVRNLVTFGGPNMGVSSPPHYPRDTWSGFILTYLANQIAYWSFSQYIVAPADYWRDPQNIEGYLKYSRFLAEANNEVNFNQTRKDMWLSLKHTTFVKWESDTTIIPRESSWWGELTPDLTVVSRFNTQVYKNDLIGIRTLEESGRADFVTIPGDHMEFTHDEINKICEKSFTQ